MHRLVFSLQNITSVPTGGAFGIYKQACIMNSYPSFLQLCVPTLLTAQGVNVQSVASVMARLIAEALL